MSLKNYIKQIEQLNEFAPSAPTIGSTPASSTSAPQKVLVKPGQPQEPQATMTNQAGKVIAQGDEDATKKIGDIVNAGGATIMDPQTGKPLEEDGQDTALSQGMNTRKVSEELAEAFAQLESQFPHEVKMYKEGWGLDEDLYHRIAEACHGAGEVPHKVWHGDLNELRNFVENIYASHHGLVDEGQFTQHDRDLNPDSYNQPRTPLQHVIAGVKKVGNKVLNTLGHGDDPDLRRELETSVGKEVAQQRQLSAQQELAQQRQRQRQIREDDLEEETSLERSLRASQQSKEETMFEGKETTDKGVKHTGSYGKRHGKEEVRDQYGARSARSISIKKQRKTSLSAAKVVLRKTQAMLV